MANNAQHSQWRDDIRSNIKKAIETGKEAGDPRIEALADIGTALATSMVIVSERVNEQTLAVVGADDYMQQLERSLERLKQDVQEFCQKIEGSEKQNFKDIQSEAERLRTHLDDFEIDQAYGSVAFIH